MYSKIKIPSLSSRGICFLYIEHAKVSRVDFSLTITDEEGTVSVPIVQVCAVFLATGTSITDKAMTMLGELGVAAVWVGEGLVRCYSSVTGVTKSSRIATQQAKLVSNTFLRAEVARKMYAMRFPDEDVSALTIQQLRGREGTRVKREYVKVAKEYGLSWSGRSSRMESIAEDDLPNQALTMATSALYGVSLAVISAIGAVPSLGFVHTGHALSFVFDIADLYKTSIALPTAFEIASSDLGINSLDSEIRKEMREIIHREKLVARIVEDIKTLLMLDDVEFSDSLYLWDESGDVVSGHTNWAFLEEEMMSP